MMPKERNNQNKALRLFFALLPDEKTVAELQQWQTHVTGKKTPMENLHMTLFFLGNQPEKHLPAFRRFMERLSFEPIEIRLDKIGFFPKIGLSWAGPSETPVSLWKLFEETRQFLIPAYLKDKSENFRPHITLARHSTKPETKTGSPIIWKAKRLVLMQSIPGGEQGKHPEYRILHEKTGYVSNSGNQSPAVSLRNT